MILVEAKCEPCATGTQPMSADEAARFARDVPGWTLRADRIERQFEFHDFREAMAFVEQVAGLAEEEGHHPDFFISYRKVVLTLSTHKIGGLSRNDFIMAAKIDDLRAEQH